MIKKTANYFSDIHRAQWKSKSGFILAAIGSAVGLGNIWRFSYLCYEHGGGAFLVPYFIALIIVGIPLMLLEFAIGHRQKGSAPKSFYKIDKKWEWVGWWPVVFIMFGIVMYYSVIISWSLNYVFYSFNLSWGSLPNDFFFNSFLNISAGPAQFGGIKTSILFGLLAIWAINWVIVFFGIEKGIERASKILMPILLLLTLVLVVWAVNLPGAKAGIVQYLKPDFSKLAQTRVWVDAFTQVFFTLSLGFGIMIAYASYLPKKADLAGNAIITVVANSLFSFVAGFAVWGTLGYMAAQKNLPISEVVEQSIGLAFVAYPQAISLMKSFAPLFGVFFFSILVFAGLSSSISIIEAFTSSIMDKFHFKRSSVVSVVSIIGFSGSIIFATGAGLYWLDIVDHYITSYGLITVGILQCLIIGWALKASKLREHINDISSLHIGKWWDIAIKIVTPSILAVILIWSLYGEFSTPYGGYSVTALILIGRDWLLATLVAAMILTRYRWRSRKG